MIINLTCLYCNHTWDRYLASKEAASKDFHCLKCKDSNVEIRESKTTKVDYYKGSPPFPQSKETLDLLEFMLVGSID